MLINKFILIYTLLCIVGALYFWESTFIPLLHICGIYVFTKINTWKIHREDYIWRMTEIIFILSISTTFGRIIFPENDKLFIVSWWIHGGLLGGIISINDPATFELYEISQSLDYLVMRINIALLNPIVSSRQPDVKTFSTSAA